MLFCCLTVADLIDLLSRSGSYYLSLGAESLPATHGNGFGLFWPLARSLGLPLIGIGCNRGAP